MLSCSKKSWHRPSLSALHCAPWDQWDYQLHGSHTAALGLLLGLETDLWLNDSETVTDHYDCQMVYDLNAVEHHSFSLAFYCTSWAASRWVLACNIHISTGRFGTVQLPELFSVSYLWSVILPFKSGNNSKSKRSGFHGTSRPQSSSAR